MDKKGEVSPSLQTHSRFPLPPLREMNSDFSPDPISLFKMERDMREFPQFFTMALAGDTNLNPPGKPDFEALRKIL
ncbi:hypothetical protein A0128_14290 [Leptospira tipperaryensis]|uniref:Uncharacterized protein n=1 Tax=Leptospira tipperaryensis TaxID=2564040 RepID=A0A1D7UZA7_9LEPT|nr:hypothetical protein A0128_14290 [Leptospira tipperaryensis]